VLDYVKMILLTNDSKLVEVNIQKRQEKRYGAMFTCLNNRELASSLSIDSAILAIRRFRARSGAFEEIYCDIRKVYWNWMVFD
jgi:hypothetical protein